MMIIRAINFHVCLDFECFFVQRINSFVIKRLVSLFHIANALTGCNNVRFYAIKLSRAVSDLNEAISSIMR